MSRVLPILFNTDMVRVILDGRKTVTRRVIKYPPHPDMPDNHDYCQMPLWRRIGKDEYGIRTLHYMDVIEQNPFKQIRYFESLAPFDKGDILYVRETWAFIPCIGCSGEYARPSAGMACYDTQAIEYDDGNSISDGCFVYRADCKNPDRICWRPSIHMPKEAARIWLKVTDVRVERLQEITEKQAKTEGVKYPCVYDKIDNKYIEIPKPEINSPATYRFGFAKLWNSTIKKFDLDRYGWDASPWVWTIEFERCEKPDIGGNYVAV